MMSFVILVMMAYFSICFSVVVMIWSVIGISYRLVISSVRAAKYEAKA